MLVALSFINYSLQEKLSYFLLLKSIANNELTIPINANDDDNPLFLGSEVTIAKTRQAPAIATATSAQVLLLLGFLPQKPILFASFDLLKVFKDFLYIGAYVVIELIIL